MNYIFWQISIKIIHEQKKKHLQLNWIQNHKCSRRWNNLNRAQLVHTNGEQTMPISNWIQSVSQSVISCEKEYLKLLRLLLSFFFFNFQKPTSINWKMENITEAMQWIGNLSTPSDILRTNETEEAKLNCLQKYPPQVCCS